MVAVLAAVFGSAGFAHLRRPGAFARAVTAHGIVPGSRLLAWLVGAVEVALAAGLAASALTGVALTTAGLAGAGLALAFAVYAHRAVRRSHGAPSDCGCGVAEAPLTVWVTWRALVLAALGVLAASADDGRAWFGHGAAEQVVMASALLSVTTAALLLPLARSRFPATVLGSAR